MPKFKILHITKYTYDIPVRDSANQIMLYPVEDNFQEVLLHELEISGDPLVEMHRDIFDNKVGTFTHSLPHKELLIRSRLEVKTQSKSLPLDQRPPHSQWESLQTLKYLFPYIEFLRHEQFYAFPELKEVMNSLHVPELTPLQCVASFCEYVFKNFTYKKGVTTVETTLDEIWKLRSGVCQDFAHILLAMLRFCNIPARYVSGYICPNKNGMRGEGATHAWVEAYLPDYGWLGFDPTNNCVANENHLKLAVGKHFYDCSPVRGTYRGTADHTLEVAVTISYEDGQISESVPTEPVLEKAPGKPRNSFRRQQEIQMQQ